VFRYFLSWRYLLSRRTNFIGIAGIFLGVFAPILIQSIMTGFLEESRRVLRGNLPDVSIEPLFDEREDGLIVSTEAGPLIRTIRADERTSGVAARLKWFGIATPSGEASGLPRQIFTSNGELSLVEIVGIDILTVDKVAIVALSNFFLQGRSFPGPRLFDEIDTTDFFTSVDREPERGSRVKNPLLPFSAPPNYSPKGRRKASIIVGEYLFYQLNLRRGSLIHLGSSTPDPITGELRPNTREFVVAGSFRSEDRASDSSRIYMARSELTDFLEDGREFSELLVSLNDYERDSATFCSDLIATAEEQALIYGGDLAEVRTWEQRREGMIGAVQNERVMMGIMLGLVLLVAGFTIYAIISMMVLELRRDIGILTTLGATPRGILSIFLLIGLWDALLGASAGGIFGTWAAFNVGGIDHWLSSQFGIEIFSHEVFAFDRIPSQVQPGVIAAMLVAGVVCTLIFAAIPAWRASRIDPLEALRSI
jgi:lipoprotein-releasing system permease protein